MTRQLNQIDAFKVDDYVVTLERLKNTVDGCPKFKAVVIHIEEGSKDFYNAVYTFHGHYMNNDKEAAWIVDYHKTNHKI